MNLRRTLLLATTPIIIVSFGFIAVNKATAQPNQQGNQNSQQQENGQQQHRHPDFAAAASKLGVTEAALKTALGVPKTPPTDGQRPPRPDFAAAASKLGVTEAALKTALGVPEHPPNQGQMGQGQGQGQGQMGQGQGQGQMGQPRRHPDFAAAASKLGVTEEALKTALGVPKTPPTDGQRPPRPDFAAAASKLGVTEAALKTALGVPEHPPSQGQMGQGGSNNGGGDRQPMSPQG